MNDENRGKWIRILRRQMRLSRPEFAERTDMTAFRVMCIECGEAAEPAELAAICGALGVEEEALDRDLPEIDDFVRKTLAKMGRMPYNDL